MRVSTDGYDYICTHIDDFKIVAKSLEHWLDLIKVIFLVKQSVPPEYSLGNDYQYEENEGLWTMGCSTYAK